jgi:predicted phage baseplate assembly protein
MPLEQEAPQLDIRTYDQIRREALLRIPRYTPEWTDWNESDPGVTLIELFAWLTEMLLVQMDRVPERSYIKFLKLLGMELRPAVPATAYLTFTAQPGAAVNPVPPGSQIAAQPPGADQVIFETSEGVALIRPPLTDVQAFDGATFTVVTPANAGPDATFRPFGWQPQVGSALYLGFTQSTPAAQEPIFPQQMNWRVFLPQNTPERRQRRCEEVQIAPVPPVELVWEYRPKDDPARWRRLQVFGDGSAAFTREGTIKVQGPVEPIMTREGRVTDERFWLRVRIAGGSYPAGAAPVISFIRPNVAQALSLATVREETLGESQGTANQPPFALQRRPVQPDSLVLETEGPDPDRKVTRWERRDDLLASGPDDPHYVLNATAGEVRFGDGINGLIPVAGSLIIARSYQYGGGQAANVGPNMITLLLSNRSDIASVMNERKAEGGNDEERIDDFLKTAPTRLRHNNRAVSTDDYKTLAEEVGGVGKAIALAQFHPDYPDVDVPGAVTVVVVPATDDPAPRPSQPLLDVVCTYLDTRRTLGAELYVVEPTYIRITVEAQVDAEPYASPDDVRNTIITAINAELDPLGRGANQSDNGRDFGLDLYPTSLYSVIQRVQYVKAVRYLVLFADGQEQDANQPINVPRDGLVYGELDHRIEVRPYQEQ